MEITKLSETGIKIKSKTSQLGVNPVTTKGKVALDAALFLGQTFDTKALAFEGEPVIIVGPGEYEIKGVKITGVGRGEDLGYAPRIEGIQVFMVKASSIAKSKELSQDCQVLVLEADADVEENVLASSNAQVIILYGAQAAAVAKKLGKEVSPVSKYVTTKDKLPSETEVVVLQ